MANPLTQASEGDTTYQFHRPTKRSDYTPVPLRWLNVLHLHLAGHTVQQIKQETGYATPTIYKILSNENIQHVRQQLLDHTQQEFEALFAKVVEAVKDGLASEDETIRMSAADKWLKAHGRYKGEGVSSATNITAEDVVVQILNQGT